MADLPTPPKSIQMKTLEYIVENLTANTSIQTYFGIGTDGRKIYMDDSGDVDSLESPKLVLTIVAENDESTSFDDPESDIRGTETNDVVIGMVVYVKVEDDTEQEDAKILTTALAALARKAVRDLDSSTDRWNTLRFLGADYEQGLYFRRANMMFKITGRSIRS